ncbi:SDR family oxidoreductase [Paraburkholderia sp. J94]|uniref:SDR family oxidoreductase n=1 Tax=Paraburkholderia sp. J94 TaxID=2805441 RepID=UPI002AAF0F1C|nr:SDR family oxidoreductase [Paraburkholderia sp. J94]
MSASTHESKPASSPALPRALPRIAAVTGAGSGIGRATAIALARNGFTVALIGRRLEPLLDTQEAIGLTGGEAQPFTADVTDADSVEHAFEQIAQRFGRLDVLFNNAGRNAGAVPLEDYELDLWNDVVATNLTGVFLCARAAYRQMKAQSPQGGRIINNGSISAHSPRPNTIAYTATKHAVTGITRSIALDGRAYNIACGQIDIGNAATPLTERMNKGVLQADGRLAPEARMDVEHVANAVVHMATLPPEANILDMTIMATTMPFVGRG